MNDEHVKSSVFLRKWHEGDSDGLNALLQRHLPWLEAKVRQRLGPVLRRKAETCDYVQDAMVEFLRYGPRFTLENESHFRALLLRVVESSLRNRHDWFTARRREIAREQPLPRDTVLALDPPRGKRDRSPSMAVAHEENEAWLRLGLELLEPDDREVLALRKWDNLSFGDIGARVGLSEAAVRMKHNRAIQKLSKKVWALRSGKLDQALEGTGPGEDESRP